MSDRRLTGRLPRTRPRSGDLLPTYDGTEDSQTRPARSWNTRATDVVAILRLPSCIAGGVGALLGAYAGSGAPGLLSARACLAFVTMAACVGVAMTFNDVIDVEIDRTEKPGRPFPSGRVSVTLGYGVVAGSALAALLAASVLGPALLVFAAAVLAVSVTYSLWIKGTVLLGNLTVAATAATPVAYGALAVGPPSPRVYLISLLVLLFMFSYEIVKTLGDRHGDAVAGLRTIATARPVPTVLGILLVVQGALVASTVLVARYASVPVLATVALVGSVVPALYASSLLYRARGGLHRPTFDRAVLFMRISWALGCLALWTLA